MNKKELGELAWKMWADDFENAKKFWISEGNAKTKSRLKTKWHNKFMENLNNFGLAVKSERCE